MSLVITIPYGELWDSINNKFIYSKEQTIAFEHSLVSISKWESKWHIPFLSSENKTTEQVFDYIKCMTLSQNVKDETYNFLTESNLKDIKEYIDDPMTATWFSEQGPKSRKIITSEVIYYYMIELGVPMECQKWHINRLLTLIRVITEERKEHKMSTNELYRRNSNLNALRKKKLGIRN